VTTYRYRGGGGGYTMSLGFPPFTRAVKWLLLINAGIFLLLVVLRLASPQLRGDLLLFGGLIPVAVTHGWVWQLVTYSFLHAGLFHLLFNMLALWMFGSQFESDWGARQFLEFYFFCVVGAALVTIAVAYTRILGMSPTTVTIGSSGGIYGILAAFGILYGDREIFLFPFPFTIKARYFVIGLIFIAVVGALSEAGGIANMAHLGGLLFGYVYVRFLPRRGLGFATSEHYYGLRNAYYRWKRRRAGKKFEVYMRKHSRSDDDFDEYGNYRDPAQRGKGNGESRRPPWVN
jgi:membrane associated rhomboid family serine protease